MLRITPIENGQLRQLRLEGKLLEPWVETVREACSLGYLALDLSAVQYVDRAGLGLLLELRQQGIEITASSGYIRELLNRGTT